MSLCEAEPEPEVVSSNDTFRGGSSLENGFDLPLGSKSGGCL